MVLKISGDPHVILAVYYRLKVGNNKKRSIEKRTWQNVIGIKETINKPCH